MLVRVISELAVAGGIMGQIWLRVSVLVVW